jgi:hypothetical protein
VKDHRPTCPNNPTLAQRWATLMDLLAHCGPDERQHLAAELAAVEAEASAAIAQATDPPHAAPIASDAAAGIVGLPPPASSCLLLPPPAPPASSCPSCLLLPLPLPRPRTDP